MIGIQELIPEMVSASVNFHDILGRELEGFADVWSQPVYLAASSFDIMGRAPVTASTASCIFSAPLAPPRHHLAPLAVPTILLLIHSSNMAKTTLNRVLRRCSFSSSNLPDLKLCAAYFSSRLKG
jgi:hypothetical protein